MAVQDTEACDRGSAQNTYYLSKCVLRSSVVLQAIYGHIRSPTTLDIVFGKETSLELLVLTEGGVLQSICEQPIFGKIKDLKLLPWNEQHRASQPQTNGKDLLVLTSDSGKMTFLTFSIELHRFLAVAHVQISQPGNARRDLGQFLAVESRGRAVSVSALEDNIAIFPTSIASGNNIVEKRMAYPAQRSTIWSVAFVSCQPGGSSKDTSMIFLAVLLHRNGATDNELLILVCDPIERSFQLKALYHPSPALTRSLAYHVIDVPLQPGFIFLLRCGYIELLEINSSGVLRMVSIVPLPNTVNHYSEGIDDQGNSAEMAPSNSTDQGDFEDTALPVISAWTWVGDSLIGSKLVFSVDTGEMYFIDLDHSTHGTIINISSCLYQTSPLKGLVSIEGGLIAALTEMGDGQVLEIKDGTICSRNIIQNVAPIFDFALVDYHNEKQDQMFACSGAGREGSLRIIRNGVTVERLISTPPIYEGVTGCWSMKICTDDVYHAFLVLSFVEETRVLSVGLNFNDITEFLGFESSACTLACSCIDDGWVAQICRKEVRVCAPTVAAHPKGIHNQLPIVCRWVPSNSNISLGAVSRKQVILSLSQPGLLVMLGFRTTHTGSKELTEIQRCLLGAELSCISIPQEQEPVPIPAIIGLADNKREVTLPNGFEVGKVCVVGTHKPSVEIVSTVPGENFKVLAMGPISIINTMGSAMGGCVPEDVRLVLFDHPYILCGLRNGMLLRFEWTTFITPSMCPFGSTDPENPFTSMDVADTKTPIPSMKEELFHYKASTFKGNQFTGYEDCQPENCSSSPAQLHLIAIRRVGVSPVSLVPLQVSLRADVIALGDRPWLLQTARCNPRIAYTSISFQPSTHATPVKSSECANGVLFVSECSLHLVEMEHSKRLNVQKLSLNMTPRKILYHADSKMIILLRSDHCDTGHGCDSEICCVDPLSGEVLVSYKFDYGEVPKCMELWKYGKEHLLLVGTGLTTGKAMMVNGEPEGARGRLLVFCLEPNHGLRNRFKSTCSTSSSLQPIHYVDDIPDVTMEDSPKDSVIFSEGEGWELFLKSHVQLSGVVLAVSPYLEKYIVASAGNILSCLTYSSESPYRLKRLASVRTRFVITSIAVHLDRIAVGDCRDGILIYTLQEADTNAKLEQLYCDPAQRLVADSVMLDLDTALVTDRRGNFCALSCPRSPEENCSPERNLVLSCWYHMGEVMMTIQKGSLAYKTLTDNIKTCNRSNNLSFDLSNGSVVASTLLGSVVVFTQLTREEYEILSELEDRLASYPLTAPVLGNNHANFRGRGCPAGVRKALDGDMLWQFLELTSSQQHQLLLADQPGLEAIHLKAFPIERVLRLLERFHNSLT